MPNSTLAGGLAPQHFASRFSDPNHAVNSGSLVALVSGGHIDNSKWKAGKRGHRMERKAARRGYSLQPQSNVANLGQRQRKGVRRFLKQVRDIGYSTASRIRFADFRLRMCCTL